MDTDFEDLNALEFASRPVSIRGNPCASVVNNREPAFAKSPPLRYLNAALL